MLNKDWGGKRHVPSGCDEARRHDLRKRSVDYQQYLKGELYNIKARANSHVNLSLQRSFLKDKLQCVLWVNDIFKKQRSRANAFYHNINLETVSGSNTRGVSLNIIYRFNHSLKRKYKGESSAEEEMRRLNYNEE